MAAAPSELLAEDVKDLRESNQRIVLRMDGLDQRMDGLDRRMDGLEKALQEMGKEFAAFRSRINANLAIVSTIALVFLGSAGMVWTGVSSLQRELGRSEAVVSHQSAMIDRLELRFDELRSLGEKLNRVSEDRARLQGRLDRDGSSPVPKGR
jgi:hypothetical protein